MEKLKSLFKQAGVNDALSAAIIEEISNHDKAVKEEYEQRFMRKLNKAEQVCKNLVNKEKTRLAKKVALYLEAKKDQIDRTAEKQRLNEDTEATSTLKRVRAMLEGIEFDDQGQNRELQATRKQLTRLQKAVSTLKEERNVAVRKANEANEIALKNLKKNRLLESKLKAASTLSENKQAGSKQSAKSKVKPKASSKQNLKEDKQKPARRRLDSSRRVSAKAKSSRPVLEDNQVRTSGKSSAGGDKAIVGIAAQMEEQSENILIY